MQISSAAPLLRRRVMRLKRWVLHLLVEGRGPRSTSRHFFKTKCSEEFGLTQPRQRSAKRWTHDNRLLWARLQNPPTHQTEAGKWRIPAVLVVAGTTKHEYQLCLWSDCACGVDEEMMNGRRRLRREAF
jgi:hypothetical protein